MNEFVSEIIFVVSRWFSSYALLVIKLVDLGASKKLD